MDMHVYEGPEDIPSDLQEHVVHYDGYAFPFWFKHPLFVSMFPLVTPAPIEDVLSSRKIRCDKYLSEHDYAGYVFCHERAFRIAALRAVTGRQHHYSVRGAHDFWKLTASVWVDCEEDERSPVWREIIEAPVPYRGFMMDHDDRAKLRGMPDYITVRRGVQANTKVEAIRAAMAGWQWTTSMDTAKFFARRFLQKHASPYVVTRKVHKNNVIAFLQQRGESEMIIDPVVWIGKARDDVELSIIDRKA